jgi:prophage regulatory protein
MGADLIKPDTSHPIRVWPAMKQDEKIIRLKTVLARTGLSRSTVYRMVANGSFPRQRRIGIQATGWYQSEVEEWISDPSAYRAGKDA